MERAISAGYAPAMFGAIPPGAVHLLNTTREIDDVYARTAEENDEGHAPNARVAQRLITWINRYLADVDRYTGRKPAKNPVAAYALSQWHPPAWMAAKGKSKRENYKPSVTGLAPNQPPAYEERQADLTEAREEPIITREPNPIPQVERAPPIVELPPPAVVTPQVTTPIAPVVPPVIDHRDHKKKWYQDRGPKKAPHWGAPLSEWKEHVQRYLDIDETSYFLGVPSPLEELAEDKEAALIRRIRGFILEGYFAPRFRYDSNRHAGRYRAIVENEGMTIVPGAKGTWDAPTDVAPSPANIARYLARNGLSFQEADDLYSFGVSFLIDERDALQEKGQHAHDGLTRSDYLRGTPEDRTAATHPLEYYLERAQELGLPDFQDVEAVPANANSLSGVEVVGGLVAALADDDDWDLDAPTSSNTRGQQMDVDDAGPAPMPKGAFTYIDVDNLADYREMVKKVEKLPCTSKPKGSRSSKDEELKPTSDSTKATSNSDLEVTYLLFRIISQIYKDSRKQALGTPISTFKYESMLISLDKFIIKEHWAWNNSL
ncbi:hypothetical protein BKA83DRAFT_4497228 [Pisolithus microcarpus]|nr:hypothetical protein BKA83DRAFT_4497228 [Pisolithus microcarpus]